MMHALRTPARALLAAVGVLTLASCAPSGGMGGGAPTAAPSRTAAAPRDPRVGLRPGMFDAGTAFWNMRLVSTTPSPEPFARSTNSDLAFSGNYVFQGNYNGYQVWDISNPAHPVLKNGYLCPASQSDVSVYKNLLFVSGEGLSGRIDCGAQGVPTAVSRDRLRGVRIFDISDLNNPRNVGNVQTCRGSHTHTVLVDPRDAENVYVYISGSAGVRSAEELPGCSSAMPNEDPNSALFRIEVIKVPVRNPERAAIVSSPRIFNDLAAPKGHGLTPAEMADARRRNAYIVDVMGEQMVLPDGFARRLLDSTVKARGGEGYAQATGADSTALRTALPEMIARMVGNRPRTGPTQCHDITVYPAIGLAGGACEGYGLLLDISDPANPRRIDAVADSNFSYWHSATFSNDGSKILFSDEWGGGGGPKCRDTDPMQWGANALFDLRDRRMTFRSYYKMPAPQTSWENCVAHNGSLIPIPGRDVMVQSWYQGGLSIFDFTDIANPREVGFFDRGPADTTGRAGAGSWSVYWYNGLIVSSEIGRGLDILELVAGPEFTQNEIDAAKTVRFEYLNVQGQQQFTWPASFALSRAYVDQLARNSGLAAGRIQAIRQALTAAEGMSGSARSQALHTLGGQIDADVAGARDGAKVRMLAASVHQLAGGM